MRPLAIVLTVVIGIGLLSGTIWLARYSPIADKPVREPFRWEIGTGEAQKELAREAAAKAKLINEHKQEVARLEDKRPAPADKAPYPKARIPEHAFDFGSMGVNEEKKHKFLIENKGQGPLEIAKGPTSCKCTIGNISQGSIPPGGTADVEMSWVPKDTTPTFAQTATIYTNDPDNLEIQFKVFGKVVRAFIVRPERNWHAGHVTDVQDGVATGSITSALDSDFKIVSVEMPDPHVKVEFHALKPKERMRESLKAGYVFTVTVDKGIPPGHFRREMKIHTTLEGDKTIDIELTALRSGPILFLSPIGNSRAYWNAEKSLVNMGRFPHQVGCKVMLPALIYGTKEKFKITGIEKDADFVRVSVVQNPEIGGHDQEGVRFVFEVPPGAPPVTRITPHGVHVKLLTNHPSLKELPFELEFVSQ